MPTRAGPKRSTGAASCCTSRRRSRWARRRSDDDLIVPARDGVLRVLRRRRDAGVSGSCSTSSFAAIGYGRRISVARSPRRTGPICRAPHLTRLREVEDDRRARRVGLRRARGRRAGARGHQSGRRARARCSGRTLSTSIELCARLMNGGVPGVPPGMTIGIVDVRDVADLHVRAMTHPCRGAAFPGDRQRFHELAGDRQLS